MDITERIKQVRNEIRHAAEKYGRDPDAVNLLAVSKTKPIDAILAAYGVGQRLFGENYLQEALDKMAELARLDIEWHFIGRIQSNKTRQIAENFAWVHGVDDLRQARRLSEQRPEQAGPLNLCLQVNLSGEKSKGGVMPTALPGLAHEIAALPRVILRGLMTLPAPESDFSLQREPFRRMRQLLEELRTQGFPVDTLSMGMSDDLEAAIAEGATIVRIGRALFGPR
ncbi:MAG: YggS family pyridoxal phosphate-dependent enzyme [Gammaproteobacteria bacterium]|nr:YggS family pyridoxal phosphate-dependent enzyme [Gammaproteobacteria bacterium]MBU1654844.1 YggS family pyridoxal phosphate-dependent enzyme [Gammaproteobacteria bacterium]MBU1961135.1 YggS family pyridoxal phosphate-dependent enzyme [Gammaproteobacteria bacterium]